ncbi:MAG: IS1595 family transposase [Bacteroidetes bacterium]|nr:IS1595 family transposase [Bacteroidota bacterium]
MTRHEILSAFEQLSVSEKRLALNAIEASWERREGLIADLAAEVMANWIKAMPCPFCQSSNTIKRGLQNGVEKFSCKECRKHYRGSHGSALFRIQRKDKWQCYLSLIEQGYSIKRAAKGLGISIQTLFDWRHKILSSLQSTLPTQLRGVVECDDFQMAESLKGQRNLERKPRKRGTDRPKHHAKKESIVTTVSRSKGGLAKVVSAKKICSKEALKALEGSLEQGTVFITNQASSYNAIARKDKSIIHK